MNNMIDVDLSFSSPKVSLSPSYFLFLSLAFLLLLFLLQAPVHPNDVSRNTPLTLLMFFREIVISPQTIKFGFHQSPPRLFFLGIHLHNHSPRKARLNQIRFLNPKPLERTREQILDQLTRRNLNSSPTPLNRKF
jgi:hypothetical protein